MKKIVLFISLTLILAAIAVGCGCNHLWRDATCSAPKTCDFCGGTRGEALEHQWTEATCAAPSTCSLCGETRGDTPEHTWMLESEIDGTCAKEGSQSYSCANCNATKTVATAKSSHQWKAATCEAAKTCADCGATEGEKLAHTFAAATCEAAKICTACGAKEGAALGHDWKAATCTAPKTCARCQATSGSAVDHSYESGRCRYCDLTDPARICQTGEVWNVPGEWQLSFDSALILKHMGNKELLQLSWSYTNTGYQGDLKIGFFNFKVYDCNNVEGDWSYDGTFANSMGLACAQGSGASCSVGSVIYNKSTAIIVEVSATDSNGTKRVQRFSIGVISADQLPQKEKLNGCTIYYSPVLPAEINEYVDSTRQSACSVTSVSFEVSSDDLFIYFSGSKTYGRSTVGACKIGVRVYDKNNKLVSSGTAYIPDLQTGGAFTAVRYKAENFVRAGEVYRVEFVDAVTRTADY